MEQPARARPPVQQNGYARPPRGFPAVGAARALLWLWLCLLLQYSGNATVDEIMHRARLVETHLVLGGVHVNVNRCGSISR